MSQWLVSDHVRTWELRFTSHGQAHISYIHWYIQRNRFGAILRTDTSFLRKCYCYALYSVDVPIASAHGHMFLPCKPISSAFLVQRYSTLH